MSHQDGLGDNGPKATGASKPDDGDDCMQKKSENVAHTRDGIKLKNLKNSGRLRNSPTTSMRGTATTSQGCYSSSCFWLTCADISRNKAGAAFGRAQEESRS